jgi:hypothetical protein
MLGELGIGTVNAVAGLAAELNLPTGLQGNLRIPPAEGDDAPLLFLLSAARTLLRSVCDGAGNVRSGFAGCRSVYTAATVVIGQRALAPVRPERVAVRLAVRKKASRL